MELMTSFVSKYLPQFCDSTLADIPELVNEESNPVLKGGTYFSYNQIRILDVGAMSKNGCYKPLFNTDKCEYSGMDMEAGKNVDIICPEPYNWKEIVSDSFDVVISGQCMEHVPKPWEWIKEVARVMKPGGLVIVIAPWKWNPHYYPLDCWRVLPDGMKGLFESVGITMIETAMRGADCYGIGTKS